MCLVALISDERERADHAAEILKRRVNEPGEGTGKGAESFGRELASKPQFRGRRWWDVEMDIRGFWEGRYPGTWEKYRESVREGYERARQTRAA
jgi:hypothetical protein